MCRLSYTPTSDTMQKSKVKSALITVLQSCRPCGQWQLLLYHAHESNSGHFTVRRLCVYLKKDGFLAFV